MKLATIPLLAAAAAAMTIASPRAWGQSPVNGDAYVQSGTNASQNFGARGNILVGPGTGATQNKGLIRFEVSEYSGISLGNVLRVILWLYVNRVTTAGTIDVYDVTSAWAEGSTTWNSPPTVGPLLGSIPVTTAQQWVGLDITSEFQGWVTTPAANNGVLLQSFTAPTTSVSLDAKENAATSHQAQLQVVMK